MQSTDIKFSPTLSCISTPILSIGRGIRKCTLAIAHKITGIKNKDIKISRQNLQSTSLNRGRSFLRNLSTSDSFSFNLSRPDSFAESITSAPENDQLRALSHYNLFKSNVPLAWVYGTTDFHHDHIDNIIDPSKPFRLPRPKLIAQSKHKTEYSGRPADKCTAHSSGLKTPAAMSEVYNDDFISDYATIFFPQNHSKSAAGEIKTVVPYEAVNPLYATIQHADTLQLPLSRSHSTTSEVSLMSIINPGGKSGDLIISKDEPIYSVIDKDAKKRDRAAKALLAEHKINIADMPGNKVKPPVPPKPQFDAKGQVIKQSLTAKKSSNAILAERNGVSKYRG